MERQPVDSSSIASVGYSPDSETLEIRFKNQTHLRILQRASGDL